MEIIIRATRTREFLGEKGRHIRELTSVVQLLTPIALLPIKILRPLVCLVRDPLRTSAAKLAGCEGGVHRSLSQHLVFLLTRVTRSHETGVFNRGEGFHVNSCWTDQLR